MSMTKEEMARDINAAVAVGRNFAAKCLEEAMDMPDFDSVGISLKEARRQRIEAAIDQIICMALLEVRNAMVAARELDHD